MFKIEHMISVSALISSRVMLNFLKTALISSNFCNSFSENCVNFIEFLQLIFGLRKFPRSLIFPALSNSSLIFDNKEKIFFKNVKSAVLLQRYLTLLNKST